jgi:hypothetical protein
MHEHVGRLHVLVRDRVVLTHKGQRHLVVKILPLASYCLMRLCQ